MKPLHELVAATHTPFFSDGSLNLSAVETQARHLEQQNIRAVFIGGSTGESHSLTLAERLALADRWFNVCQGSATRIIVHVGTNCLEDARTLAAQAEKLGAAAISALCPCYFKPRSVDVLVDCAAYIASAAPNTPFYHYDIPALTNVHFSMAEFLEKAPARIPNLAGIKFTNPDLMAYQQALRVGAGQWDLPFGVDEHFLGGMVMGAKGAVGSGFNFAAPVYHRLMAAYASGDLEKARIEQYRGVQIIQILASYGYMGAAKALMEMLGVPVGPARLPNTNLTDTQKAELRSKLEQMGFFAWLEQK